MIRTKAVMSATVLGLLLVFVSTAAGQTERERERELNDRDIELRSWNLKIISLEVNKQRKSKLRPEQALAQVQKDFTRLQVVNKNLVFSISDKRDLDFKFVAECATEIRERSARLNDTLALPTVDKTEIQAPQSANNSTHLKLSVLRLGNLIYNFTNNPFFKEPGVVNTEGTLKAKRELLEIVELSGQIKKDTDRLEKEDHK